MNILSKHWQPMQLLRTVFTFRIWQTLSFVPYILNAIEGVEQLGGGGGA